MSMNPITDVVVHYSATYPDQDYGVKEIDAMHRARGWAGVGYHWVNTRGGEMQQGRKETQLGAHVRGKNSNKIGICNIGGLAYETGGNVGVDTRTPEQIASLIDKITEIKNRWPKANVNGHRDHVATQCPGFDAAAWWATVKGDRVPTEVTPPPQAPAVTMGYVQKGSRGNTVKVLQEALRILGFHTTRVDGDFGRLTEAAVRDFQRWAKVVADGKVGRVTWGKLFEHGGIK